VGRIQLVKSPGLGGVLSNGFSVTLSPSAPEGRDSVQFNLLKGVGQASNRLGLWAEAAQYARTRIEALGLGPCSACRPRSFDPSLGLYDVKQTDGFEQLGKVASAVVARIDRSLAPRRTAGRIERRPTSTASICTSGRTTQHFRRSLAYVGFGWRLPLISWRVWVETGL
jgi:hypothetical protein